MIEIGKINIQEQGEIFKHEENVELRINQKVIGPGVLDITESSLCWKPNNHDDGIKFPWPSVSLHAVMDKPIRSIYFMINNVLSWPGVYDGNVSNGSGHDEDADEDEDENVEELEEEENQYCEFYLIPSDVNKISDLYSAMSVCQSKHPDSQGSTDDSDSEEYMEAMEEETDENESNDHLQNMENLLIDDTDKFADADESSEQNRNV